MNVQNFKEVAVDRSRLWTRGERMEGTQITPWFLTHESGWINSSAILWDKENGKERKLGRQIITFNLEFEESL